MCIYNNACFLLFATANLNSVPSVEVETETDIDSEDEECHEADDEGSDGKDDNEAVQKVMPDLSTISTKTDKSIEFEFVQVSTELQQAGKKRYWSKSRLIL